MPGTAAVRATVLAAVVLWACAEILKIRRPTHVEPARRLWTAAIVLMILHAVLAFHVVYGWRHATAVIETARQTAAVTGLEWGGGIFVNYVFLAAWTIDAAWWWIAPRAYVRRSASF